MVHGLIFRALIFMVLLGASLAAQEPSHQARASVAPYLMPANHPIKPLLDSLFSSSRATFNLQSLQKAGFQKAKPRKYTKLIVTSHPAFPGYIFKLYLDVQRFHKNEHEHYFWVLRCRGAEKIRQVIADQGLGSLFKVPQKWIYRLPRQTTLPEGYYLKYYILVEENMDILSDRENKDLWASNYVNTELLDGLYKILDQVGLYDCAKPDNIPFSRDGKVAFIDTQTFNRKVRFSQFTHFLSRENQSYWEAITSGAKRH